MLNVSLFEYSDLNLSLICGQASVTRRMDSPMSEALLALALARVADTDPRCAAQRHYSDFRCFENASLLCRLGGMRIWLHIIM